MLKMVHVEFTAVFVLPVTMSPLGQNAMVDESFGANGTVRIAVSSGQSADDEAYSVVIQPAEKKYTTGGENWFER